MNENADRKAADTEQPDFFADTELPNLIPIAENEDVEFSEAYADEDDMEALERAEAADRRQKNR